MPYIYYILNIEVSYCILHSGKKSEKSLAEGSFTEVALEDLWVWIDHQDHNSSLLLLLILCASIVSLLQNRAEYTGQCMHIQLMEDNSDDRKIWD